MSALESLAWGVLALVFGSIVRDDIQPLTDSRIPVREPDAYRWARHQYYAPGDAAHDARIARDWAKFA